MAEATIDNVQHALTYILLTLLPIIFHWFGSLLKTTATQLFECREGHYLHLPIWHFPVEHCKKKLSTRSLLLASKASVHHVPSTRSLVALTYLLPVDIIAYKAGCQVERFLQGFCHLFHRPHMLQRIAYQSERGYSTLLPTMRFDTDSFLIGINSFASVTMVTRPDQFEDLILDTGQSVQGIEGGLAIKGHGTFKFNIEDDKGTVHSIKIVDSMYVLTSRIVSSRRNIGHKRHRKVREEQEWKPTATTLALYGARESFDAQFLTVGTQTLRFFVQLRPRQPITHSPPTSKRWKLNSTVENRSSSSLDVIA